MPLWSFNNTCSLDTSAAASDIIWCTWNNEYLPLYGVTTNEIGNVSSSWDTSTSGASTSISSVVWSSWNNSFVATYGTDQMPRVIRRIEPPVGNREPRKPSIAVQNAEKLLLSVLDEKQKEDWVARGQFYVHVGPRKYRIRRGRIGNVELVDPETNEPLQRYCAHPVQHVPDEDTAVAQLLHLRHDEQRFIGLANVHYTKPGFVGGLRG